MGPLASLLTLIGVAAVAKKICDGPKKDDDDEEPRNDDSSEYIETTNSRCPEGDDIRLHM